MGCLGIVGLFANLRANGAELTVQPFARPAPVHAGRGTLGKPRPQSLEQAYEMRSPTSGEVELRAHTLQNVTLSEQHVPHLPDLVAIAR